MRPLYEGIGQLLSWFEQTVVTLKIESVFFVLILILQNVYNNNNTIDTFQNKTVKWQKDNLQCIKT